MSSAQKIVKKILAEADIKINGDRPQDLQVKNEKLFSRVLAGGSLALGESYMDGWWDAKELDEFFNKVLSADLGRKIVPSLQLLSEVIKSRILNPQRKSKAFEIGEQHYDVGNDLYSKMLDGRMTYTCGYWKDLDQVSENLDKAQEAKLDLVCRKIGLKKGDRVLDIGCGWGSFAKFAAEKYGAEVVGITISKEQIELGREMCKGLPVDLWLMDYRDVKEEFDHIVSLGMFEHVGQKNYREYMEIAHKCLKDGGFFLLHTIGGNRSVISADPWIGKYIFTNSMLPSIKQVGESTEGLFIMEDWHNFSFYYYPTLLAWFHNFEKAWPNLKDKYGDRFYRMWKYYLMASAGSFKSRKNQLWQVVLSKNGVPGGYQSVR
ncbi:MAG: cyclopropane fatty acyl phospholipid synthase [Candidatus Paceibacterota bacterium]